jgi:hypothetical protein
VREAPAPGVDTEDDLARANDEWTRVHSPAISPGRS